MTLAPKLISPELMGLTWGFLVSPSSCENPGYYENYLRLCALADKNTHKTVTHVMLDTDTGRIAGYVALRTTSLTITDADGVYCGNPALEIAELAVAQDYERQGVGTELISYAFALAFELTKTIAAVGYVVVCADHSAVGFYEKQGFAPIRNVYTLPRDGWNNHCVPLYVQLPDD